MFLTIRLNKPNIKFSRIKNKQKSFLISRHSSTHQQYFFNFKNSSKIMNNPICETFTDLPVKFDIEKLAAEQKPKAQEENIIESKSPKDFLNIPDKNWVVLPMFENHLDHLKPFFSIRHDKYMRQRYRKFLDNVPECYVTITQFGSNINSQPKPRRKSLNGQFYGVDYKLAPIPVSVDPRKGSTKPNKPKH